MQQMVLLGLGLLAMANIAWTRDAPSRAPVKGCAWEKLADATLGLEGWIQRCDFGLRKINLYAKQNALMIHWSDGGEDSPLIETFDLLADEKPDSAIKRIFAEHTADKNLVAALAAQAVQGRRPACGAAVAGVTLHVPA